MAPVEETDKKNQTPLPSGTVARELRWVTNMRVIPFYTVRQYTPMYSMEHFVFIQDVAKNKGCLRPSN